MITETGTIFIDLQGERYYTDGPQVYTGSRVEIVPLDNTKELAVDSRFLGLEVDVDPPYLYVDQVYPNILPPYRIIQNVLGQVQQQNVSAIDDIYSKLVLRTTIDGLIGEATAQLETYVGNEITEATAGLALRSYVDGEIGSASASILTQVENDRNSAFAALDMEGYVDGEVAQAIAGLRTEVSNDIDNAVAGLALESYVDGQIASASASIYANVSSQVSSATANLALESYVDEEIATATADLVTQVELGNELDNYATTSAFNSLESRVETTEQGISANSQLINGVETSLDVNLRTIIRSDTEPTTRDDGEDLVAGDIWIDTDDSNTSYTWNGTSWEPYEGALKAEVSGNSSAVQTLTSTVSSQGDEITANANAITVIQGDISSLDTDMEKALTGDFQAFIDLSGEVSTNEGNISSNSNLIAGVSSTISNDLKTVIRTATEPEERPSGDSLKEGDIWVDSDDDDASYVWDGAAWTPYDKKLKDAYNATANATLTLQGQVEGDGSNPGLLNSVAALQASVTSIEDSPPGAKVFRQQDEPPNRGLDSSGDPIPLATGDIWVNTDPTPAEELGSVHSWDGSQWVEVEEGFKTGFAGLQTEVTSLSDNIEARAVLYAKADGSIAAVDLVANSDTGSTISIQADAINIDGTTTFASNYDPSSKETPDGAQAKADAALQAANQSVSDLQDEVNTTFRDGVIDESEIIAINESIRQLESKKAELDSRYTKVVNSSSLSGAPKTDLQDAKTDFDQDHTSLVDYINNAIGNGEITESEKTNIEGLFTAYRTGLGQLEEALDGAREAIAQAKADAAESSANDYTVQQLAIGLAGVGVTIRSATAPTERQDQTPLQAGDTWIDTDDGDAPYTYDGTDPYNISGWKRSYTRIDGGYIVTGVVDADRLDVDGIFAKDATIARTLSVGDPTSVIITGLTSQTAPNTTASVDKTLGPYTVGTDGNGPLDVNLSTKGASGHGEQESLFLEYDIDFSNITSTPVDNRESLFIVVRIRGRVGTGSWKVIDDTIYGQNEDGEAVEYPSGTVTNEAFLANTSFYDEINLNAFIFGAIGGSDTFDITNVSYKTTNITVGVKPEGMFYKDASGIEKPFGLAEGRGSSVSVVSAWEDILNNPFSGSGPLELDDSLAVAGALDVTNNVSIANPTFGANNALTGATGDARYAQKTGTYSGLRAQSTTKGDVGLGNVLNEEQVPKSGGTFTGAITALRTIQTNIGGVSDLNSMGPDTRFFEFTTPSNLPTGVESNRGVGIQIKRGFSAANPSRFQLILDREGSMWARGANNEGDLPGSWNSWKRQYGEGDSVQLGSGTFNGSLDITNSLQVYSGNEKIYTNKVNDGHSALYFDAKGVVGKNYIISYGEGNIRHPTFAFKNNQPDGKIQFHTDSTSRVEINSNSTVINNTLLANSGFEGSTGYFSDLVTADNFKVDNGLTIYDDHINYGDFKEYYGIWGVADDSGSSSNKWIKVMEATLGPPQYESFRAEFDGGGRIGGSRSEGNPFIGYVICRNTSGSSISSATVYLQQKTDATPSVKDIKLIHRETIGTNTNVVEVWVQFATSYQIDSQ
jgi:hypothetical protein